MIKADDPKKRGKASRNKGANAEREFAKIMCEKYGIEAHRGYVFYHQSDLVGLKGIHPEIKRREAVNLKSWLIQAEHESKIKRDGLPVVFYRQDRKPWMVAMYVKYFAQMIGSSNDNDGYVVMELNTFMEIWRSYADSID